MGSPISPVLSNIFMQFFERNLISPIFDLNTNIWFRYVDDIFTIVPNSHNLNELLDNINSLHENIKFKIEVENNNQLPFLDCLILRDTQSNIPHFKVYRKPTHSNSYIHSFSHHSLNIKIGTMTNIFNRAYNICTPQFLNNEIDYIFKSFTDLGYDNKLIKKAHQKARNIYFQTKEKNTFELSKVLVIPTLNSLPNNFRNICNEMNINLVHKSNNTLKSKLKHHIKNNDTITNKQNVIYHIPCSVCTHCYIGETSDFERRMYQHKYAYRNMDTNNALVKHTVDKDHRIHIENSNIICKQNDTNKRKLIESIIINNTNNFNITQSNYNFDSFSNKIIINNVPKIRKHLNTIHNFTPQIT